MLKESPLKLVNEITNIEEKLQLPQTTRVVPEKVPEKGPHDEKTKEEIIDEFYKADVRQQIKILKHLGQNTESDENIEFRQKNGQLRYGDVISITFQEDVFAKRLQENEAVPTIDHKQQEDAPNQQQTNINPFDEPDFVYRGMVYSDGIIDANIKVIPQVTESNANASNMFKQCLFMIEVEQECDANEKAAKLLEQKKDIEHRRHKLMTQGGGEAYIDNEKLRRINQELQKILKKIDENDLEKQKQKRNNEYEQKYRIGNKITYGQPFQLRHMFTGKYLSLNSQEMSTEYGCCELNLSETNKECVFLFDPPTLNTNMKGLTVDYSDYFCIRNKMMDSPFYFHVFKKQQDSNSWDKKDKIYNLNASQDHSIFKAKLFMSYEEQDKAKSHIQSGDVIRLKHTFIDSYLTTSQINVDEIIPPKPDFLKQQIRRMNNGEQIEYPKGGKEWYDMSMRDKKEMELDHEYQINDSTDDYVKNLKERHQQEVFLETNESRLFFTNSCWEIQRVNSLQGGSIVINEIVKFKHVGTGKFLSIQNEKDLVLKNSSNNLNCLFIMRADNAQKKNNENQVVDNQGIRTGQQIIIQSWLSDNYLQVENDSDLNSQMELLNNSVIINNQKDELDSEVSLINHKFQKVNKKKMIFQIEEIPFEEAIQSYQSSYIFDEMLQYYSYLNNWAIHPNEQQDQVEKFYYKHDLAVERSNDLCEETTKIQIIINNIFDNINENINIPQKYDLCKTQLQEQGILDIVCRLLEILYYKSAPPPMFQKPFKSQQGKADLKKSNEDEANKLKIDKAQKSKVDDKQNDTINKTKSDEKQNDANLKNKSSENYSNDVDLNQVKIDEYIAQKIVRETTEELQMMMLQLLTVMIKGHRINSERITKYFNILYQHFFVHEHYSDLNKINPKFKTQNPKAFIKIIGELFKKSQKNAMYVQSDQSASSPSDLDNTFGIDNTAFKNDDSGSTDQIKKWLDLLEPVRYKSDDHDQNLEKQITILNILSMFCRNKEGQGVYLYQMQVIRHIFEKDENIPIRFATEKVGNVLRPFICFVKPKDQMEQKEMTNLFFKKSNDLVDMQQKNKNMYEELDLHEITKKYDSKENDIQPYIDYLCAVLNLYSHMCLSANTHAIKQLMEIGLTEAHILLCIHQDSDRLHIHEKIKQSYMSIARSMYIYNDPISPGIAQKNRCYIWEKLKKLKKDEKGFDEEFHKEDDDLTSIENDFHAGKGKKKLTQADDPNNSMIVLKQEQDSKDLALIKMIRKDITWFMLDGPSGTDEFFYQFEEEGKFMPNQLKLKIKSLKIYLDAINALIQEDCVSPNFIENVKLTCLCAMMGCIYNSSETKQEQIPNYVTDNWVYKLCWIATTLFNQNPQENRQMYNAMNVVQIKVLEIFEKLSGYRLNQQIQQFLYMFTEFQQENIDLHSDSDLFSPELEEAFNNIFKKNKIDIDIKKTDVYLNLKRQEEAAAKNKSNADQKNNDEIQEGKYKSDKKLSIANVDEEHEKKIGFEKIFTKYVFLDNVNLIVRQKALQVLISDFVQRDQVIKELLRTEVIVSPQDYRDYINILTKQRQVRQLTKKIVQDEMLHSIQKKSSFLETKHAKNDIVHILKALNNDLENADTVEKKRLQNIIRHIGLLNDVLNGLMKSLVQKELSYRSLFQACIDFFYQLAFDNPSCQQILLPQLTYFLDLLNKQIRTGSLISEIIKGNQDPKQIQNFSEYLISKIVSEGYFTSNLIRQLIQLAQSTPKLDLGIEDNIYMEQAKIDQQNENPNQQIILKQLIKSHKFRSLLMMKRQYNHQKIGIIKSYTKKREQYNVSKKPVDEPLLKEKEFLDLHLSVVDLVATCAKNSPFCIAQAQKLIEKEELLDSILSESIPYVVKRHYFVLLYEVYLRKVPNIDEGHRLPVTDIKFNQVMKWVILWDLEISFNHYGGLILEDQPADTPDVQRKLRQVKRDISKATETEQEENQKTEKEQEEEMQTKSQLTSFKETTPYLVLDSNDKSEYWRYLYEHPEGDTNPIGILIFIENFFRDYSDKELDDESMADSISRIRDRLLALVNKIFFFVDQHESYMKPYVQDFLKFASKAIQRIPNMRSLSIGKKRISKDKGVNDVEDMNNISFNIDESRDVQNRMAGDKVLKILRDYIIKENMHIKDALGVDTTADSMINKETLKENIKKITGASASYDDIMKALDYFHQISFEKKQERQVNANAEPGQTGYVMNRTELQMNLELELKSNKINFKDVELQLKDVLKKAGYKPPNQQRGVGDEFEKLNPQISEDEYSVAINMDLKLYIHKFNEYINMTESYSEIHDYVHFLMTSDFVVDRQSKLRLIKNLIHGFTGLQGDQDDLILTQILNLILKRNIPDDDLKSVAGSLVDRKRNQRDIKQLLKDLSEWQNVMFEAEVPQFLLSMIDINNENNFLMNKCLIVINNILCNSNGQNQQRMLDILKNDNLFFNVFFYISQRLEDSKNYIIYKIKQGAQKKFIQKNMKNNYVEKIKPNDFKRQKIYNNQKFNIEKKFLSQKENWRDDEINNLLIFMNCLCENCFEPAQNYLRQQLQDDEKKANLKNGKMTSIDLLYKIVTIFIDLVNQLKDYVFSDFRTYKLIPILLDTLIEFIYGPNEKNQQFLGEWKKLIVVLNSLIDQEKFGNYTGIHQEAKAQLSILQSTCSVLLTVADIKDTEKAKKTHALMIEELNIDNLVKKMVDIYVFKIGGSPQTQRVYEYNLVCNHYDNHSKEKSYKCIENEFCELGYLIPRDVLTIQTGFNIYMLLQILNKSYPDKMRQFKRHEEEFVFLLEQQKKLDKFLFKQSKVTSKKTQEIYNVFDASEQDLLDDLIINSFPETFVAFVLKKASESTDTSQSQMLISKINKMRQANNQNDRMYLLKNIRNFIMSKENKQENQIEDNDYDEDSTEELLKNENDNEDAKVPIVESKGLSSKIFSLNKNNKVVDSSVGDQNNQESVQNHEKQKIDTGLEKYKFHMASNFYEDNIGCIEVVRKPNDQEEIPGIINVSFQIPSYIKCLTMKTRDKTPYLLNSVSQQEKLEFFVHETSIMQTEMKWQQNLGRVSPVLKTFANQWENIAWINLGLIFIINILLISFLTAPKGDYKSQGILTSDEKALIDLMGYLQTICALFVMIAYFIEQQANLKFKREQQNVDQVDDVPGYGYNYGSMGYGNRKAEINYVKAIPSFSFDKLAQKSSKSIIGKLMFMFVKVAKLFIESIYYDRDHMRNVAYFCLSLLTNLSNLIYALLLLDIMFKIQQLNQVLSIFGENKLALGYTLLLFFVVLYIFSFFGFTEFRSQYWGDNIDKGSCDQLGKCLLFTAQYGLRAGGGIADEIQSENWDNADFSYRYVFDLSFFFIVNIVLMNIFFGIIIDSFASKRDKEAEVTIEVENQCFICSLQKSVFEIENESWKQHIFCDHNLHGYLAFIIYVKNKDPWECTGIEKWVKQCLKEQTIDFFPVNRTKKIKDGQLYEQQ